MFTVLIQNQRTMSSFYEHLPLFTSFIENGELEVCLWNENGSSVEEALPDLHDLTDSKGRWKALIVRYEDDEPMASFSSAEDNPYDYQQREVQQGQKLSGIPLVRLTQLLSRPLQHADRNIRDLQKTDIPIYNGIYPESITLISVRHADGLTEVVGGDSRLENPDFVRENGYPGSCRFTVVDRFSQGPNKKISDDFQFWLLVLLMAVNRTESSLLPAHQLHALSCRIDNEELQQFWNQKCGLLDQSSDQIRKALAHQSVYLKKYEGKEPEYRVALEHIPLNRSEKELNIDSRSYQKESRDPHAQNNEWRKKCMDAKQEILSLYAGVPNELQKKTAALHKRRGFEEDEVDILSELQRKKLEEELDTLNLKIIDEMSQLPLIEFTDGDELDKAGQRVERMILDRAQSPRIWYWSVGFSVIGLFCLLFGWIGVFSGYRVGVIWLILLTVVLVGGPLAASWLILYLQKKAISQAIHQWNRLIEQKFQKLLEYRNLYQDYLSDVLSWRRGKSYLDIAVRKADTARADQRKLEKLMENMSRFRKQIERWAGAMSIPLDSIAEEQYSLKQLIQDQIQKQIFTMEPEYSTKCHVNGTGKYIAAPFPFVQELNVKTLSGRVRYE